MYTARQLLMEFFDCLRDLDTSVDRCVDLFAEDGTFEFPYLSTCGMESKFQGKAAIRAVLELIRSHFPAFTLSRIAIHETSDGAGLFVEYHADAVATGAGKGYSQEYVSHLVVEHGKIKLLREYLNIIAFARQLLPNGLADVP
jgi:ketosteroid isomerase-like protein